MNKRSALSVFILIALFVLILVSVSDNHKANAMELSITPSETNILNEYLLHDKITIKSDIKVDYYGEKTASNPFVELPSGELIKTNELEFSQTGTYKIKYNLIHNSLPITFTQEIEVKDNYFTISVDNGSYIKKSDDIDRLNSSKDGLIASLAEDTTLYYNKIINLNDVDENGLSNVIEVEPILGHFTDSKYVADQSKIYVTLTDCYDERITLTLKMGRSENYTGTFFPGVLTYMQVCKGLDKGDLPNLGRTRQIVLDGEKYRLWPDEEGSMNVGMFNATSSMTTGAKWMYEPSTKRVYLTYNDKENFLVTDLDEPIIYESEGLFPGFTTGEVKVSIHALSYYSPINARIELISIGNDNLYELYDNKYSDNVKPIINTKYDKDSFYVALGEKVNIPNAEVIDVNKRSDAIINVYTGYNTDNRVNVSIENNSFIASKPDLYTIEYKAIDKAGNETIKTINVIVKETANSKTINLELEPFALSCGSITKFKYNVTESLNSNIEDVKVVISVSSPHQNQIIDSTNEFIPFYDDEYRVTVEYSDKVSHYVDEYIVKSQKTDEIFFVDNFKLPKYFIKGFKYAIDNVYAYTFINGYPETKTPNYYAVYDGEEVEIKDLSNFTIDSSKDSVKLVARLNDYSLESKEIEILDCSYNDDYKKIDMTKLFLGDFTPNYINDKGNRIADIVYVSNKLNGSNTLSFINSVLVDMFKLTYRITEQNSNYESFTIKLTDSIDESLYSTIKFYNKEDGTYISINNESLQKLNDYSFYSNNKNTIMYNYYSSSLYVGTNIFKVKFNCPSNKCYIGITLDGIYDNAGIQISEINNQIISGNNYNDNAAPEIVYQDFQGHYPLGEVINISKFYSGDVLKGIDVNTISFSVVGPDGSTVYDKDDNVITSLDPNVYNTIKLTNIGNYYCIYKVQDFNGRVSTAQVCISCIDTTNPEIVLDNMNDGATIIVKAGNKIEIDFTIKDDLSIPKNMKAFIHLYCIDQYSYVPNISKIDYKNMPEDGKFKESFVINVRGNYEAQIHVYDEYGNEAVKRIEIIVE